MKQISLFVVVLLVTTGLNAFAWQPKYKDGPFLSYNYGGDLGEDTFGFGWQVARRFTEVLSLEGTFSYHEDRSLEITGFRPGLPDSHVDLQVLGFGLTGRAGFRPTTNTYVYAGAGIAFFNINTDAKPVRNAQAARGGPDFGFYEADVQHEWGSHFALGLELALTRRWETFVEFRQTYLEPEVKTRFAPDIDAPTQVTRQRFDYDFSMFRVGINYRF